MEENSWVSIKGSDKTKIRGITAAWWKPVLKFVLRPYLSDVVSYKKKVALECLFTALCYDKIILKNAVKTLVPKGGKKGHA